MCILVKTALETDNTPDDGLNIFEKDVRDFCYELKLSVERNLTNTSTFLKTNIENLENILLEAIEKERPGND